MVNQWLQECSWGQGAPQPCSLTALLFCSPTAHSTTALQPRSPAAHMGAAQSPRELQELPVSLREEGGKHLYAARAV